jgi:hypothetical protein
MPPPDAAAHHAAFQKLWDEHADLIHSILTHHLGPDHEDATQVLGARLWHVFPEKHDQELAALAAGLPSPHAWPNYIAVAASHVGLDAARERHDDRTHLESLERRRAHRLSNATLDDPDPDPLTAGDCWPDPAAADPAAAAPFADMTQTISDALKKMSPEERDAAIACLEEWWDTEQARRRAISVSTARRRRLKAQSLLAESLTTAGYSPDCHPEHLCHPEHREGSVSSEDPRP